MNIEKETGGVWTTYERQLTDPSVVFQSANAVFVSLVRLDPLPSVYKPALHCPVRAPRVQVTIHQLRGEKSTSAMASQAPP